LLPSDKANNSLNLLYMISYSRTIGSDTLTKKGFRDIKALM